MIKDNTIPNLFHHNKDKLRRERSKICQGMKMHRKSSTVRMRKHLNSMIILRNLNTILLARKSRRLKTRNIEAQTDIIYHEKYIQCNIQNDTLMKVITNQLMTWTHNLYFLKVVAVVVATLI